MKFVVTRTSNWKEEPEPGLSVETVRVLGYANRDERMVERSVVELETIEQLMDWMQSLTFELGEPAIVIWSPNRDYGYELPQIEIYDQRRED